MMRAAAGIALAFLLALPSAAAAQSPATAAGALGDARTLAWFSGCWELRRGAMITQEQWMAPSGGAMLGMSRSVRNDSLREWEYVFVGPVDGRLAYVAKPSGQSGATFPALVANDTLAVFEQAAHDFPQRIVYQRRGGDSLHAYIEGAIDGRTRRVDFRYARVACPGAAR